MRARESVLIEDPLVFFFYLPLTLAFRPKRFIEVKLALKLQLFFFFSRYICAYFPTPPYRLHSEEKLRCRTDADRPVGKENGAERAR